MNFNKVVGQQKIIAQLQQFVVKDRVPHAMMLETKEGRGGLLLAIALANLLQCTDVRDGDSCGKCADCQKTFQLIHPDIHFSYPVIKADGKRRDESFSNDFLNPWRSIVLENPYFSYQAWLEKIGAEKTAANINVKECNEIIKKLSLRAYSGKKKVLIMWLPEFLGKEGNRLLKLIEEPTDDTVIIFVTHQSSKILNTIHSRCQILRLPIIADESMSSYLTDSFGLDGPDLANVIQLSEGNLVTAIEMANGFDSNLSEEVISWLLRNYEFKIEELANWIDNFARESKEYQKQFFRFTNYISRSLLKRQLLGKNTAEAIESRGINFEKLAKILTLDKVESLTQITDKSIDEIDRNISVKIMMMAASLKVSKLLRE